MWKTTNVSMRRTDIKTSSRSRLLLGILNNINTHGRVVISS